MDVIIYIRLIRIENVHVLEMSLASKDVSCITNLQVLHSSRRIEYRFVHAYLRFGNENVSCVKSITIEYYLST